VHTDTQAADSAQAVNAQAYTVSNHVVFGTGHYAPETNTGRQLLTHELAHVSMNTSSPEAVSTDLQVSHPKDHSEREADRAASQILQTGLPQSSVYTLGPEAGRTTVFRAPLKDSSTTRKGGCGPDVTAWFVSQLNAARSNPSVLTVAERLSLAEAYGRQAGFSSMDVVEGRLKGSVKEAAEDLGDPPPTASAKTQMNQADPKDQYNESKGKAVREAVNPFDLEKPAVAMFTSLYLGGSLWKSLVKTNGLFDLKNGRLRADNLTGYCPSPCQVKGHPTLTLCNSCFDYGLPGNIFYGHIGRFCGFTLNALQLGSQFANLLPDGGASWDTKDDTAAIDLGFNLPPEAGVSEGSLCNKVVLAKGSLESQDDCTPCNRALRSAGGATSFDDLKAQYREYGDVLGSDGIVRPGPGPKY